MAVLGLVMPRPAHFLVMEIHNAQPASGRTVLRSR
ncbi:hypothetical protein BN13_860009 [Nostocoides jenkinsii Ben 74]|uniref:Uncharacterized protein n=1 Tax=Nostocoides jenkinsii Ben 74 TaxID=1193518 RepID=A0A077MDW5_9MICO|nr:hypothetical protein BN13_860009 [Tetrasphaera jenkinsii Ben 74]